ncbi:MAG: M23 family metallopeptidase [Gammaproteobacteria bacterium]|nr:M23 family metallopeptidase [Gammaproteobacteria bacterium]
MAHLTTWTLVLVSCLLLLGCSFKPAPSKYLNYHTKTNLIFPLSGESLIGTGGRLAEQNPDHIYAKDQRFAIDIVALAPGASPPALDNLVTRALSGQIAVYRGDDYYKNANHYCFGRQIVSPGNGEVIDAKDGVFDNIPGERNTKDGPGNYVVIDHRNGEFSMLAHFRKGSLSVTKGEKVSAGTLLGECGNSGNSNLPHLHYHLQTTGRWHDGEGLPAQFQNYYSNGKLVNRGEPVQGEIISHVIDN